MRSSAVDEDGAAASFAGQHETYLNIVGVGANLVTGNADEIMINASWGLGESILGSTVTPDTFVVRKSDLAITQRIIADKQCMTISVSGGTEEVDVPRFMRARAALNDEQAREMAQLALTLEETIGYPVDVECAYASGKLYLLAMVCMPVMNRIFLHGGRDKVESRREMFGRFVETETAVTHMPLQTIVSNNRFQLHNTAGPRPFSLLHAHNIRHKDIVQKKIDKSGRYECNSSGRLYSGITVSVLIQCRRERA